MSRPLTSSPSAPLLRLLCVVLTAAALAAAGSAQQKRQPKPKSPATQPSKPAAPPDLAVPFRAGEQLTMRVLWSKYSVNAATVNFSVVERRDFFGSPAWHFRVTGHTMDTVRLIYPLDDQVDSYSDAQRLASLQYELYLHEMGKQVTDIFHITSGSDPAPPGATAAHVAPGTRDPVGILYALRAVDWKTTPEYHSAVFDGVHQYNVTARLAQPSGDISVPAGMFKASRIDLQVLEKGKELPDMHFGLWIAQDAPHLPVLLEVTAPAPVGTARVELVSAPSTP